MCSSHSSYIYMKLSSYFQFLSYLDCFPYKSLKTKYRLKIRWQFYKLKLKTGNKKK